MASKEDVRASAEQERKLEGGEAPPPAKPESPKDNGIHPAFYIA